METNKLNIVVIQGGLNQVYTNCVNKFNNYKEIKDQLIYNLTGDKNKFQEFFNSIKINYNIFTMNLNSIILENPNLNFDNLINDNTNLFKDFNFIEKEIFLEIISQNIKIIFLYDDPLDAIIDSLILQSHKENKEDYNELFEFRILNGLFMEEVKENPKNYLIYTHNLEDIIIFGPIGTWTCYLTHYIFTDHYTLNEKSPLNKLNKINIDLLSKNQKFFNFSTQTFYQLRNYYKYIKEANQKIDSNKSDENILKNIFNSFNPIRVLTFYKTHFKKLELKKSLHYTSNERVWYISHIGGMTNDFNNDVELEINGDFDAILIKISQIQEYYNYTNFISKVENFPKSNPNVMLINSSENLLNVLKRDTMIELLEDFTKLEELKKLNETNNTNLLIPRCFSVDLKEVYELEQFRNFITEKKLKLPLIIKYSGPNSDYNHLLITIITEEGLKNYIEFFKKFSKNYESEISMVIQSYVNHGGYVMKMYRVNQEGKIHLRPSLPNVSEELTHQHEEYKMGFFRIETNELLSEKYVNFWKKLENDSNINEMINREYIDDVSTLFEKYSKMTLFGLDFLFDVVKREYYVVDVNCFPGYKELKSQFNDIITEHIVKYWDKFKLTKNIFE